MNDVTPCALCATHAKFRPMPPPCALCAILRPTPLQPSKTRLLHVAAAVPSLSSQAHVSTSLLASNEAIRLVNRTELAHEGLIKVENSSEGVRLPYVLRLGNAVLFGPIAYVLFSGSRGRDPVIGM